MPQQHPPWEQVALELVRSHDAVSLLKLLHRHHNNLNISEPFTYNTMLHLASIHGFPDIVYLLLNRGASVDACNSMQRTPLMCACAEGHELVVKLLLEYHADIEARDMEGCTPLILAASQGSTSIFSILLNHHANFRTQDDNGMTCLIYASLRGHLDIVQLLLELPDVNIEAHNVQGFNALIHASIRGHTTIVKALLDHGAKIDAAAYGIDSISWAQQNQNHETVTILMDYRHRAQRI